jgi:OCT family organic cation transporter-like MFS transporter 4/5
VGTSGVYPLAFILGVEMVGKGKREMAGVVLNYFYSIGEALVGIIAWLDGDWVNLQYWVSVPPILFIVYYWIIPESPRWLMAKKLNLKALEVIQKVAKKNTGTELSQNVIDKFKNDKLHDDDTQQKILEKASFKGLLNSRLLMIRCLILFFIWGTNAFVFYGLSLNAINLSGNIHLNFILGCLIEIPGNTIAWVRDFLFSFSFIIFTFNRS